MDTTMNTPMNTPMNTTMDTKTKKVANAKAEAKDPVAIGVAAYEKFIAAGGVSRPTFGENCGNPPQGWKPRLET